MRSHLRAALALALALPLSLLAPSLQAQHFNNQPAAGVLGQANFADAVPATTAGNLTLPLAIASDPSGDLLFVADTSNRRVLRFAAVNSYNAGSNSHRVYGQPDFLSNLADTGANRFQSTGGVAVDREGTLWVADSGNHRILGFPAATALPVFSPPFANEAATRVLGQADFVS